MKKLLAGFALCGLLVPAQAEQSLEQAASDPTASLMSLQFSDWHNYKYHHSDVDDNIIVLRAAVPFKIGEQKHMMRVTAPIVTSNPVLDDGLSDITLFDMAVFDQSWGRFGVGLVALLPTGGSKRGAEKWGLGPALGFVARQETLMWGLFNQNVFTVAGEDSRKDINMSSLQPIFNYKLGGGWSTGFSEMQITYDWEQHRWSSLPLGFGINKLERFSQTTPPIQFSMQYEHNFADEDVTPSDTLRITAKFLLPTL